MTIWKEVKEKIYDCLTLINIDGLGGRYYFGKNNYRSQIKHCTESKESHRL